MIITEQNYFDLDNKGLSQSKIKDYLKCPNYFYRKNISGEYVRPVKKAFQIGDAIDNILTQAETPDGYAVCENKRTTKAGKAEAADLEFAGKKVISRTDFNTIIEAADAVDKTEAYQEIKNTFTFQEIIEIEKELGEHFKVLYGKLDAYRINSDGVCDLLDLKSAMTIEERQYFYKFFSFGYDKQIWFYAYLLKLKYPKIKSFRYWHLAVEKSEPFRVKLFTIPNRFIDKCEKEMLATIDKIAHDKEFNKETVSFKSPIELGDIYEVEDNDNDEF